MICAKLLLKEGAYVNCRGENGHTPLHILTGNVSHLEERNLMVYLKCQSLLLDNSDVDVNAINGLMQTPLSILFSSLSSSIHTSHSDIFQNLFSSGAKFSEVEVSQLSEVGIKLTGKQNTSNEKYNFNIYNFIIGRGEKAFPWKIEDTLSPSFYNRYIGTKSLLYHIVEFVDVTVLEQLLIQEVNPWIINIDNSKIPLHAALVRGNIKVVELLLHYMKDPVSDNNIIDLRNYTFSLLQSLLCNTQQETCRLPESNVDHVKCFKALISDEVRLDLKQSSSTNEYTVECLFAMIPNGPMKDVVVENGLWIAAVDQRDNTEGKYDYNSN